MIRKAVIVLLTLGMLGAMLLLVVTYRAPRTYSTYLSDGLWIEVSVTDGVASILILEGPRTVLFRTFTDSFAHGRGILRSKYGSTPSAKNIGPLPLGIRAKGIDLPLLLVFILSAIYPVIAFFRGPVVRWDRLMSGLCITCGYNLTGLPEPRCPECGTEFDAKRLSQDKRVGPNGKA